MSSPGACSLETETWSASAGQGLLVDSGSPRGAGSSSARLVGRAGRTRLVRRGSSASRLVGGPAPPRPARRRRSRSPPPGRRPSPTSPSASAARRVGVGLARRGPRLVVPARRLVAVAHRGRLASGQACSGSKRTLWCCRVRACGRACRASTRGRPVLGVGLDLDRLLRDDGEPEARDAGDLLRVVREHADRGQAEVGEDLRADPVLPRVGREAELEVRLDGVEPCSCSSYARSLLRSPIPRPSWAR